MRPRTPSIIWIPFVFSIGTISWVLLLVGLALISVVVVVPAMKDVKDAEKTRNDYQATIDQLDEKIALQKEFIAAADKDPVLMERLAARQLNLYRKDQELWIPRREDLFKDHSVDELLAESLVPVKPKEVPGIAPPLDKVLLPGMRTSLIIAGCAALGLSFFLGVRYER